ncbi:hypothetical protein [Hymenobacter sp.]|uniref:hypothetical protein n=1 Tax=Hymenobacter sp. TaxID=1898978 RepID=UPI00286B7640|nr:hypothetical protein [Hymenobacter sp.]
MATVISFSALSPAAQLLAVRPLRRDMVRRLGPSDASLLWWRQAVLAADPVLEWSADRGTAIVRRGQALLDRVARCYLVTRPPVPDLIDEELLALLP